MVKTKNIIISGTNFWNPGDDFVRDGVIRILHELFPEHQLNFLFYNFNQDFFPQSKFSGIHNMAAKGDLEQYKDSVDYIVIAGLSAGNEIKDLYNWIIENNLHDRVYLIGAGYENSYVDTHIYEEPELTIFKNAKIITSRTARAPKIIGELNLPFHHINCPAILSVPKVKNVPQNKKIERIAFSVQLPHEIGVPNHACAKEMYSLSVNLIAELYDKYEVEVIAHHKSEYFHFLKLFKENNINIPVIFSSYYQDLFEIYKRYDLMITTRLHASLFANGFGIPGIILNDTDRHTHCLQGFPHSVWVNSKEKFDLAFEKVLQLNLKKTAEEADLFKKNLLKNYVNILKEPFGINGADIGSVKGRTSFKINKGNSGSDNLPVHFFTIVLNGKPFIDYHINVFKNLPFKWHWHVIEGVADLKNDTAWSVQNGGHIDESLHNNGLSNDGTSEYLDSIKKMYPDNVTIYRKEKGKFWNGKLEMVNAPLSNINEECILWEIDSDELWTAEQLVSGRQLYLNDPDKTSSYYFCAFFVGEKLVITSTNTYGNHTDFEWLRSWRYMPGDKWMSHEPPKLCRRDASGDWKDLGKVNPLTHADTLRSKLIFQHYAYVVPKQLKFKEKYYGYADALSQWERLQFQTQFPVKLKDYFEWVNDEAVVDKSDKFGVRLLAVKKNNEWSFNYEDAEVKKANKILFVRTDSIGDVVLASSMLEPIKNKYSDSSLYVLCQDHVKALLENSPFADKIIGFNKKAMLENSRYRDDLLKSLRNEKFDLVLNSVYSSEDITDLIALGAGGKETVGFNENPEDVSYRGSKKEIQNYDKLVQTDSKLNELNKFRKYLDELDVPSGKLSATVWTNSQAEEFAEEFFNANNLKKDNTIAFFPFAQHHHKEYSKYEDVLRVYSNYKILIFGGEEKSSREDLASWSKYPNCINLVGKTDLNQTVSLIKRCALYVGADTSGAHIANAVNVPNVVVLGGAHFGRFLPYSNLTSVISEPMDCYGCGWRCTQDSVKCVQNIKPENLIFAIETTLAGLSDKPRIFVQSSVKGFEQIIQEYVNPDDFEIIDCDSSGDLAEIEQMINEGDYVTAMKLLTELLEETPEDIDALIDLAVVQSLTGDNETAVKLLLAVLQLDPENQVAINNLYAIQNQNTQEVSE